MALKEVAPVLAKDFVTLKIDTDRMSGGSEMRTRYAKTQQGIPWFGFLDGDGNTIVTSNAPDGGNIGFPAEDDEIAHFKVMLGKAATRMTRDDIEMLAKSLVAFRDVRVE